MGRDSSLHAIIFFGQDEESNCQDQRGAALPEEAGWQPSMGTSTARQGAALFSSYNPQISLCTCKAKVSMIQTYISVNKASTQRRNIMSFLICYTEENSGMLAPRDTFFFFFFFGFHCHFSSVERGRHSGSGCICFHYWQEENFHFPTELKVQEPAQFPSITSESFSLDHLLS